MQPVAPPAPQGLHCTRARGVDRAAFGSGARSTVSHGAGQHRQAADADLDPEPRPRHDRAWPGNLVAMRRWRFRGPACSAARTQTSPARAPPRSRNTMSAGRTIRRCESARPNVILTNQDDPTSTLTLVVDGPSSLVLTNSGQPGTDFPFGGSIVLSSSTPRRHLFGHIQCDRRLLNRPKATFFAHFSGFNGHG